MKKNLNRTCHPLKIFFGAEIILYLLHILCIAHFPNPAPSHWANNGAVDASMNLWWYLVVDLLPFVILFLIMLVDQAKGSLSLYTQTKMWRIFSYTFISLMTLATWIPELLIFSSAAGLPGKIHLISVVCKIALVVLVLMLLCVPLSTIPKAFFLRKKSSH